MATESKEYDSLDKLFSPVRQPKSGFQWQPDHYQKSMGLIPTDSEYFERTLAGKVTRKAGEFNVQKPPFGLDYDRVEIELEDVATGFKEGGPKEARLFRVALLKNDRECDHLFPVKVVGIPDMIQEEELAVVFNKFGEVGNVYVPRNGETRKACCSFAVVRFVDKASADRAMLAGKAYIKGKYCGPKPFLVTMDPLPHQQSVFTKNSGVHGMTNAITEEMITQYTLEKHTIVPVKQAITLEECFSRSGYPWGSKQELRILEEHAPKEAMAYFSIHLTNLNHYTSPQELERIFRDEFHLQVGSVYCPRPLIIDDRLNDGRKNDGFGFIRFPHVEDMKKALTAIENQLVVIEGNLVQGKRNQPYQWPREDFRKYH